MARPEVDGAGTARAIERAVPDDEYPHLVRTGAGWKIANPPWRPA